MEIRQHDRTGTARGLLHGYWMLSGYGLRASRALGWLAVAMLVTIVLLMGFGLPKDDPKQEATGTVPPGGGRVTFEIGKDDPPNPTGNQFTGERFEKALNVTLKLSCLPLRRPRFDHRWHLHRDDLPPGRAHPPGPRGPRRPQPRQTLTRRSRRPVRTSSDGLDGSPSLGPTAGGVGGLGSGVDSISRCEPSLTGLSSWLPPSANH
ncbi:hypothetical protein ACFY3E_42145 [Streptomyces griseorubiginosus]|uniref:hypothetical protein n=1 Tax=Streptomyces griseorubiginosus TaxID=67304 RepID=UPI0036856784